MSTKMGNALAGKTAGVSRFQTAIASARVSVPYVIPGINLPCLMTLLGTEKMLDLDGQVLRLMEQRGFTQAPETAYLSQDKYELQRALMYLQLACIDDDPKNPQPIGTREDWGALSVEVIAAAWFRFNELRAQFDPLADGARVTTLEILEIKDAIQKKSGASLRSFGLQRLTAYLLTMGDQPASLPTPKSEGGDTSPDASSGSEPVVEAASPT